MIFAHGPTGFVLSYIFKKSFKKHFYFWLAFVFAIFPDIDVVYYYFFNAQAGHRENITHTFLLYLILSLILLFFSSKAALAVFVGSFSHLLVDSLGYGVGWLWPFSKELYGLARFYFLQSFLENYSFVFNYFLEFLALLGFVTILVRRRWFYCFWLLVPPTLIFLLFVNQHLFHGKATTYFGDFDQDGIINKDDLDVDGDGILNLEDVDSNGNGLNNIDEMISWAKKFNSLWYDFSEDGLIEIPSRFGFLSNVSAIRRIVEETGIYWREEFTSDYRKNLQGYISTPFDDRFDHQPENLLAFLQHKNLLVSEAQKGDIIFYGDNKVAIVTEIVDNKIFIAEMTKEWQGERELTEKINYVGRLGSRF